MDKTELWLAITAAAAALTLVVVWISSYQSKGAERIELHQVAWTFVGFVFAIAILIGFGDALIHGYGDGDLF